MSNAPRTPRYVQVNIGRNVGDEPMTNNLWAQFQQDVAEAIAYATVIGGMQAVQVHVGKGEWAGALEDSAHISTFADVDLFKLRYDLDKLKRTYQQDAIALIAGSDLI